MSNTVRWTGQVSVEHLAHLSEATAAVRDNVHLAATADNVQLAARSENDRRSVIGSTPVRNPDETERTGDGRIKTLVDASTLADYFNSFDADVCEVEIISEPEEIVNITLSGGSLTINASYESRRPWKGTFSEPEYQADVEIDISKFVPALDLLSKTDPGDPEHVLIGVSDQVICAYAWGELVELLIGVRPSEVHTYSAPFHTVYPYDTLRNSLRVFDTDSSIRVKLASPKDSSSWATGGQAKFEAIDTEYDLTFWVKPQYVTTAGSPPNIGQKLLATFRDQDTISEGDLRWVPC